MHFGRGERSTSAENIVLRNTQKNEFDYLLFLDSRWLSLNESVKESTIFYQVLKTFEEHKLTYLAISRPKNLTVLPTLINFIEANPKFVFKYLITNLGFVDTTPKKRENIEDICVQLGEENVKKCKIIELESYLMSSGIEEKLYSIEYSKALIRDFSNIFEQYFSKIFCINTPIVPITFQFERIRPKSFYIRLESSNALLKEMARINSNVTIVDIASLGVESNLTYDAVHYTSYGHQLIYKTIVDKIL